MRAHKHTPRKHAHPRLWKQVRQATALRAALAAASGAGGSPVGSAGPWGRPGRNGAGDALDALRFVTVPEVARDIACGAGHRRQPRRGKRVGGVDTRPSEIYGDDDDDGFGSVGSWGHGSGSGSDGSDDGDGDEDEDADEAAAWSEQQLLKQLFYPTGQREGQRGAEGVKGGTCVRVHAHACLLVWRHVLRQHYRVHCSV